MSRTRTRILIVLALLFAAILFLPLRLATTLVGLDDTGISARAASGTVWGGRLHEAQAGAFALGTLDVGLKPLPLLLGRASFDVARSEGDGAPPIAGIVSVGPGRRAVEALTGAVSGGTIGGVPVESISFDQANAVFADGRCSTASGRVTAVVGLSVAGLQLRNGMTGGLNCEGGALVANMVGQSGMERLILTIDGDGSYVARLLVQSTDPVLGAALSAAGFGPTAEGFVRTMRGRF